MWAIFPDFRFCSNEFVNKVRLVFLEILVCFVQRQIFAYTTQVFYANNIGKIMGFLTGKRILVTGLASNRSIAYGIAKSMKEQGAELAFTYLNDKLQPRVEEFAKEFGSDIVLPLDVATDESIQNCFAELSKRWDKFDGFIHAIAFAPGDQLDGDYVNAATREGYRIAHDISAYSFVAMAQAARPYLNQMPHY